MGGRVRLISLVALSAAMLLAGVPSPASAASGDDVDFVGSGWGHGVGMSQYGAYGMATDGYSYAEILTHYYQGTSISTLSSGTSIWVNLEENFTSRTLTVHGVTASPTPVQVKLGSQVLLTAQPGATIELSPDSGSGCTVTVTNPGGSPQSVTDDTWCGIDFTWYDWTAGGLPPTLVQIEGCDRNDWQTGVLRPCQYARGHLHLRSGGPGAGLYLSAEMLIDDYVLGISEVPYLWDSDALKAQAVAARSYARSRSLQRGVPFYNGEYNGDNGCWCQVRDTTSDQAYVGWGHGGGAVDRWVDATRDTARDVLTHPDAGNGVITAFYSSSSGGRTEFGHVKGFASGPVEWLSSEDDHWAVDGTVSNPNASWVKTHSAGTVANALGWDILTSAEVTSTRPGSGSAAEVRFTGIDAGQNVSVVWESGDVRRTFDLKSEYFDVDYQASSGSLLHPPGDELLFYRSNGVFRYNSLHADGTVGAPIHSGSNYTSNWKSISALDLDGDGQDEIMFYRDDGLYRYYEIGIDGRVGTPIRSGDEYTHGWDSITAIDLDGDGQDEIFFYRGDGIYRYYDIRPDGRIGSPIREGDEYTHGWDSITAVDLDGDGQDEMFYYRDDGLYRYYDIRPDGRIGSPIRSGDTYTHDWTSITAVDLDGDGQDEMFFYRDDGLYRFYDIRSNGELGSPIKSGSGFSTGWSLIRTINLDGQ